MSSTNKKDEKFDFIFVVLCYRNIHDLQKFINSANELEDTFKIIVVNSYFDDETKEYLQEIALNNNCDFINVPNKGYGAGNNTGIEHAQSNYEFEYIVVCNPDIELINFSQEYFRNKKDYIIAPDIRTLTGKPQNPFIDSSNKFVEWIEYHGYRYQSKFLLYSGFGINKIFREVSNVLWKMTRKRREIYASHGSCVIFGKDALKKLGRPYDENMFLFCEEFHLAKLAESKGVTTIMMSELKILHKEDGSVVFIGDKAFGLQAKSYIYYYENWYKKQE